MRPDEGIIGRQPNDLPRNRQDSICGRGGGGGLRSGSVKSTCEKLREIAGKLRCRNQTSRSLNGQHFCTGDTQGTDKGAQWTSRCGRSAKNCENCGNLRNCEKVQKNCGPQSPPPPSVCGGGESKGRHMEQKRHTQTCHGCLAGELSLIREEPRTICPSVMPLAVAA